MTQKREEKKRSPSKADAIPHASSVLQGDELIPFLGPCVNACGQWPCPFPPIYNSEIRHPLLHPQSIQFKIPLLVFNPPWTAAVYSTSSPSH